MLSALRAVRPLRPLGLRPPLSAAGTSPEKKVGRIRNQPEPCFFGSICIHRYLHTYLCTYMDIYVNNINPIILKMN